MNYTNQNLLLKTLIWTVKNRIDESCEKEDMELALSIKKPMYFIQMRQMFGPVGQEIFGD